MRHRQYLLPVAVMFALACSFGATAARLARDPLEGKWQAVITPDENSSAKEFKDIFEFKPGTFVCVARAKLLGFEPGPYEEDVRIGGAGQFSAVQKSKTGQGTDKWQGTVTAGEMSGELEWTKKDGSVLHYTFKATRQ